MEWQILVGYAGALLIGVVLGLIGGGGSILTVPIMVYLLSVEQELATAYSLFVVGTAAAAGAIRYWQQRQIALLTALAFTLPSFVVVLVTRLYILPVIPDPLGFGLGLAVPKGAFIMLIFAVVMLLAAFSMLSSQKSDPPKEETPTQRALNYPLIILDGALVGLVTGITGAGGGFLIVPALVLLTGLPIKKAVGTSLLIIAINSLVGFLGDVGLRTIDWPFLLTFTGLAIVGILLGSWLNQFVPGSRLKAAFGWMVLLIGALILIGELISL